jgi:hypothetical protein
MNKEVSPDWLISGRLREWLSRRAFCGGSARELAEPLLVNSANCRNSGIIHTRAADSQA